MKRYIRSFQYLTEDLCIMGRRREIELEKIEINVRKNVARFIEVNGKYIKDVCDDKNAEDKTPSGHYQDTRKWLFKIKTN